LFIRRTAVVCHAVAQVKVGFLQFFITDNNVSNIFFAFTVVKFVIFWLPLDFDAAATIYIERSSAKQGLSKLISRHLHGNLN